MATATKAVDPVCGMEVDPAGAAGESTLGGTTYHFCSTACKQKFDTDPSRYTASVPTKTGVGLTKKTAPDGSPHPRSPPDGGAERIDLPISGMSCAACARRIEQTLGRTPGVRKAGVNFATAK